MLIYATTAELQEWLDGEALPANAASLLRSASLMVRSETMTAVYDTDDQGKPTDTATAEAFRDATCAQAQAWAAMGIKPTTAGVPQAAPVRSKKLASGGIEYDTSVNSSVAAFQAKQQAAKTLCAESWMILQQAGLMPGSVQRG